MTKKLLSILFVVMLLFSTAAVAEQTQNLIANGGFEELDSSGEPIGWYTMSYRSEQGYSRLKITDEKAHSGRYSAMVENATANDARYVYSASVEPNSLYKLSGYVYVESMGEEGNGANLAIEDIYAFSDCLHAAQDSWQYVEWYGETSENQREVLLGVRVGGYGSESVGKAYFDDMTLEKVDSLPQGVVAAIWYPIVAPSAAAESTADAPQKSTLLFVVLAMAFVLLCWLLRPTLKKGKGRFTAAAFAVLMLVGLAVRVWLGMNVAGYQVDISCFTAWSLRMADMGPVGFYAPDYFCDYPPGYMLLLWPCGLLLRGLSAYSATVGSVALLIVKSVPILCDMAGAWVLFAYARKKLNDIPALALSALYLLNPVILVNGAAWGQADSVLALLLLLCVIFAMERRWQVALPLYTLAILVKPQALLFAPVAGLWLLYVLLSRQQKQKKNLRQLWIGLGISVAVALVIIVPFSIGQEQPVGWLFSLYGDTLSSYAYATLNTANLYYLLAANWMPLGTLVPTMLTIGTAVVSALLAGWTWLTLRKQKASFSWRNYQSQLMLLLGLFALVQLVLSLTGAVYSLYGYLMMALVYAFVLLTMQHRPEAKTLPFYLALALIGIYMLGIKVHERYLFPAILLLYVSYVTIKDKRMLVLAAGLSVTTFLNTAIVLDNSILYGSTLGHLNDDTLVLNVALCILNLLMLAFSIHIALTPCAAQAQAQSEEADEQPEAAFAVPEGYEQMLLKPKDAALRLTVKDWLIMGVVTVLYGVLAFANLGSTVAPQDGWVSSSSDETIVFELEKDTTFKFMYYAGVSYNSFSIAVSSDGEAWTDPFPCEMREGLCYRWNYALQSVTDAAGNVTYGDNSPTGVLYMSGRYVKLNAEAAGLNLFEVAFRDIEGNQLAAKIISHENANPQILDEAKPAENLLNEQDTCVGEPGWYTGTYFDEIYHARTAYEHLHGEKPYETTHPPLGKLIMAVGIAIFGMTPFGWRFSGALIGVLMLPALYLLAKQLFKRRDLAALSMIAFSLDLMHYAQTRIATIDSFPVFFIILSYLCMVRYMQTDVFAVKDQTDLKLLNRAFWKSLIPLALSGLFMGLSIASKWIGLYSAVGLAVLFFVQCWRQFRAGNFAFSYLVPGDEAKPEEQELRIRSAQDYALKRIFVTCGFCILFFIVVPCVIYYLSYIPYLSPTGPVTLKRVIQAQQGMLSYHSTPGLGMDHPFQSPWWQWPFILKPMWFAQDKFEPVGYGSTIMCMGNPWVFYIGAFCMAAVIVALAVKYLRLSRKGLALRNGDGNLTLAVLVVGFAAQYLPWVLVPRSMYMYHYFASVPFIILATAWVIGLLPEKWKRLRWGIIGVYLLGAAVFFVMFFPYASGWLTSTDWLNTMQWFSKLYY